MENKNSYTSEPYRHPAMRTKGLTVDDSRVVPLTVNDDRVVPLTAEGIHDGVKAQPPSIFFPRFTPSTWEPTFKQWGPWDQEYPGTPEPRIWPTHLPGEVSEGPSPLAEALRKMFEPKKAEAPVKEPSPPPEPDKAHTFLEEAGSVMKQRAELRDRDGGERSMEAIVNMFKAYKGDGWDGKMSEEDGWVFMIILKLVRGSHGFYNRDDYVDGAAYFGLLGESASKHMPRKK